MSKKVAAQVVMTANIILDAGQSMEAEVGGEVLEKLVKADP